MTRALPAGTLAVRMNWRAAQAPGRTVTRAAAAELIVYESVGDVVPMFRVDGRGPQGTPTRT